ncbi:hypothetical protein ACFQQB_38625 [Nonomuraea rubra]
MNPTLSELEAKARRPAAAFGGDAHIVCDNLVRIYKTEGSRSSRCRAWTW